VSVQRIRIRDPLGGPDIVRDIDLGAANGWVKGAKGSVVGSATVGNMNPVIKGAVPNLSHLNRGKEASRAFNR